MLEGDGRDEEEVPGRGDARRGWGKHRRAHRGDGVIKAAAEGGMRGGDHNIFSVSHESPLGW